MKQERSPNIICDRLIDLLPRNRSVSKKNIHHAIDDLLERSIGRMEQRMAAFTDGEEKFLVALARQDYVLEPLGKAFIAEAGLSAAGIAKIVKHLEDEAIIYKLNEGYTIGDPLLKHYIKRYR